MRLRSAEHRSDPTDLLDDGYLSMESNRPEKVVMSNHYSGAYLHFPGDDARLDLTDLYVFPTPGSSGRTSLILDANPYMTGLSATPPFLLTETLRTDAVYRINIDNDGDLLADAA